MDLAGSVALVTGASSGLGHRFATVLASAGAKAAIAGRRVDRLEELAHAIGAAGGTALPVVMDVAAPASILTGLARIEAEWGLVEMLVNNAGMPDAALATKAPLDLIERVIDTNLKGPFLLAREVAGRLIKAGRQGRIVNISSSSAYHYDRAGSALYSITKAAVSRMTEVLAVEWAARGINVNAISPGSFATEMMDGAIGRVGDAFIQAYPRKRLGDPRQLDSTLLYLLSPASDAVTGTIIKVDDGQFPR